MKKKFIQILMLLIATVSVGSFVSCKDTSEDLYNELRTQALSDNATLEEALNARLAALDDQIQAYKDALAALKSCECDPQVIVDLTGDVETLKTLLEGLDRNTVDFLIDLAKPIADQKTIIQILQDKIKELEDLKIADNFNDIFDRLLKLEQFQSEAIEDIKAALQKANDAQAAADNAKALAEAAQAAADKAQGKADQAWDEIVKVTKDLSEKIQKNADAIDSLKDRVSKIEGRLDTMDATIGIMQGQIKEAYDEAKAAAATANANYLEIEKLKLQYENLEKALDNLKNAADASELDELKARIAELEDKVSCHNAELATLYVEFGLVAAESIAHMEAAKCYADKQIESAKDLILAQVTALLKDYIKKGDFDLSNYVTKAEIDNYLKTSDAAAIYATKAELANYVPQSTLDALLLALENKLTAADAALELALTKAITDEIGKLKLDELRAQVNKNTTDIEWLKTLYGEISDKLDNFVTKDDVNKWIDDIIEIWKETIGTGGDQNNVGNTYNITDLLDIIVELTKTDVAADINLKIANIEGELADCVKHSELSLILSGYVKKEDIPDGLVEALATLAEIKTKVDGMADHEERIKALEEAAGGLGDLATLMADVAILKSTAITMDDIKDFIKKEDLEKYVTKEEYDKFVTETFVAEKNSLWTAVNKNTSDIGTIKGQISDINNEISGIKTKLEDLQDQIDAANKKINDLETKFGKAIKTIQNKLDKQITSIIIQGTKNPMFGSFSLPADIQSNILVAYFGKPTSAIEFPTTDDANYVRKSEVLTAEDWAMINDVTVFTQIANKTLLNDDGSGNANAGKIYMTINPNTADLSGLKLSIVNSQDEESPIKLSPIKPSSKTLQFGYTRADNGFYEANAYVSLADIKSGKNGLALSPEDITALFYEAKDQIAKLADNFFTEGKQTNLEKLSVEIYNVLQKLKVDQSGLKCTYTYDNDGTSVEESVYSPYNLAATFMNPLNLASFKDLSYVTMPGYEAVDKLLDDMAGTIKDHVSVFYNSAVNIDQIKDLIDGLQIDEVKYMGLSDNYIAKFNVRISHMTLDGYDYQVTVPAAGSFKIMFDKDLKASGSAVTVPAEVTYDKENIDLKSPAIVIGGDINTGMDVTLVIPATGGDGKVSAYATMKLFDSTAKATLAGSTIELTTPSGTFTIANFASNTIATSGCTEKVVLSDVAGNDGALYLPIITEITGDLRDLLAQQKTTLEDLVDDLNVILDRINSYEGVVNGWIDSFVDEYLRKYLDQVNSDIVFFVNSLNRRFGPFLVASNDAKGFKTLSHSKSYPTILDKAGLKLYPTSKTLELIVPLARKHVAVTNVFKGSASAQGGNADCKTKLQKANTGKMNTVIDGMARSIDVTGMESGYVYEVAYSILDFEGNISTQKYYISIK